LRRNASRYVNVPFKAPFEIIGYLYEPAGRADLIGGRLMKLRSGASCTITVGGFRMARHVALIALILVTYISPTLAQDAGQQGDSPQGGRARGVCRDDVQKLCAGIERGGGHIRDCLVSQKDKLSEDCRKRIESRGD
jgi:hypothetical protein